MTAQMIDVVFEISGSTLPPSYPYALWDELTRLLPQLAETENVGVVPLRMAESAEGMLIPRRAKLALRLPPTLVEAASALMHRQLRVAGSHISLGACKPRPIQEHPTLHAHLVTGSPDEAAFVEEVRSALSEMGVKANLICGQRNRLADGGRVIEGYSLVLHDLTPEGSLQVQYIGLGAERRFGCGVFVPYKVISGLE